jgi:ribosomal protein S27AE
MASEVETFEFMCTSCGISHLLSLDGILMGFSMEYQRQIAINKQCPLCGGELMVIGPKDQEPFYRTGKTP